MYQQNFSNLQSAQTQPLHFHLNEQDVANLVLSELKRTAREYTTAALEATHPAVRQTFVSLTQKTLQDQAELYNVLSQSGGYGSISMASQQEVQQELQQQLRKTEQLHAVVQQAVQAAYAGGNLYAQSAHHQTQAYPQAQPVYQAPVHQTGYPSGGATTTSSTASPYGGSSFTAFPSGTYGQTTGSGFGHTTTGSSSYGSSTGTTAGSSLTGTGAGQTSGASAYNPGLSQVVGSSFGSSLSSSAGAHNNEYGVKSSVTGTDSQDYFSARSVQDFNNNKYSSGHETYAGTTSSHNTSYAPSSSVHPAGSSSSFGSVSSGAEAATSGQASASGSYRNKTQSHSQHGTTHSSKYMM